MINVGNPLPRISFLKRPCILLVILVTITVFIVGLPKCQAVTLTVATTNGSVEVIPDKADYDIGEVVEIIPRPDTGYCFTGWSGDAHSRRLVLRVTMDSDKAITADFHAWTSPIGVPEPPFGIYETHRMYDDPAKRNPDLTYHQNTEGGYYTHYIDNTHPDATDTDNPYGSGSKPRATIPGSPIELSPGSVVEVHGGPYTTILNYVELIANGNSNYPIFVRGVNSNNMPLISLKQLRIIGSYLIIENLNFDGGRLVLHGNDDQDFMAIRHSELQNSTGSAIWINTARDIVVYSNEIHNNIEYPMEGDYGYSGIELWGGDRIWLVDNHIHYNGEDGFQSYGGISNYVYIARNVIHSDRENAIDNKVSQNCVISQNTIYGYHMSDSSSGQAIRINDEGDTSSTWVIFNEIYDSLIGTDTWGVNSPPYIIGNIIHDLEGKTFDGRYFESVGMSGGGAGYVINNIVYNVDKGIAEDNAVIVNNIVSEASEYHIFGNVEIRNNLLWQSGKPIVLGGTALPIDCIEANPQFIDPEKVDFHLKPTSPAIDAGTSSGVVQEVFDRFEQLYGIDIRRDIEGRVRPQGSGWDIGAYEYTLSEVPDLAVSGMSQNSVTVVWTMPGEEGVTDRPWRYDIRYSASAITEVNWDAATQVQGEPAPGDFGEQQSFTITGLNPNTTYYVAIKTSNNIGSTTSPLSNVASGTTTASGNHAPVLEFIGDKSIEENQTLTFVVNATDADPGDTLIYSATDIPMGADFNPATRTFAWTPSSSQSGIYHVTFHVSDGQITVSETIMITVIGIQSTLTISSTSGGSVTNPGEGIFSYDEGAFVSIQATPAANYHFVNWTGTAVDAGKVTNPSSASTTVKMDADYTIQANFAIDRHTLTFSSTSGGSVTVPGEGDFLYNHGTFVAIRASLEGSYRFVNWTGTAVDAGKVQNPNAAQTTVTTDADYTIIANFGEQDGVPPTITSLSPAADDIQVPLNSLIILHVTDAGIGVDASSVTIALDGDIVYTGDTSFYSSASGHCCRVGTLADYTYVYQSTQNFDFDETKIVTVNAADLGGTAMAEQSYSFTTEMRSFGQNKQVDTIIEGLDKAAPSTAHDNSGNIWAVWHAGPIGSRDIYIAKLEAGSETFDGSIPLISNVADQSNPAIAVGADDRLYVVWQDNRQADDNDQGEWDIYLSTSLDGVTWSVEKRINDPNEDNQTNPAIVVDSQFPNYAHVAWQDDRAGNQDICIASSNDRFATQSVSQITNDPLDQTEPVIAVDSSNTIYVLWTDARNPANGYDIYGAASNIGPWTNVPVVAKEAAQTSPAIAVESTNSILHMLWVDQTPGDSGIYYASSNGLPGSPLAGGNLIDGYATGKGQFSPAITVTGSTGNGLRVFTCWHDERDVSGSIGDTDIWFVQANAGSGTNVFVGDGGTNSDQTEPAIGIDTYGHPYILWTDGRGGNTEIYFAASTYMNPSALASEWVTPSSLDVTVGTAVEDITEVDDVSVELLAGICPYDVNVMITKIENPPEYALRYFLNGYDFGPSGIVFNIPLTITIPYAVTGAAGTPTAYWYNSRTGALSQEGITNIEIIELTLNLHALQFKTTHLTPFFAVRSLPSGGGGGGGGCSLSHSQDGSIVEFFFPYGILALVLIVLKWRDRKFRAHCEKTTSS